MKKREFKAIDLFSGCGGLTLGLKMAGFNVIGAVDSDTLSVETYRMNHPDVHVWETDIRKLSISEIKRKLNLKPGSLDLLAGCPPCQGFSSIRTHNSSFEVNDSRNDLIFDFERIIRGLKPKAVMMENVPGLAKNERFLNLCNSLKELGYRVNYDILNAADYGVPQRRHRLILLGGRKNQIDFAKPIADKFTVRDAIYFMPIPGDSGDTLHDWPEKRTKKVVELIKSVPKNGGSRKDLDKRFQLDCHKKCNGFKDVYGRMKWDEVSPTITSGCFNPSKGRFIHPEQDRAITLREAALIQSFPSNYLFSLSKGKCKVANMIGNALPSLFVFKQAKRINNYLTRICCNQKGE